MLQINKELDYAIHLILALGKLPTGEILSLKTFSKENNISFLFLQRIVCSLKKSGMINSSRGIKGGYYLNRELKEITLKDLILAMDGNEYSISKCLNNDKVCKKFKECAVKKIFIEINQNLNEIFKKIILFSSK